MDKMVWNGKEYDLAVKTMKIARLIETAEQSASVYDAYKGQFEVVKAALGQEAAKELLGTLNIEEMDLNVMVMVYNAVVTGYERRVMEMRKEQEADFVDTPTIRTVKELADSMKVINFVDRRGG